MADTKKKVGRPRIYTEKLDAVAIKLPAEQVEWLHRDGSRQASKRLRNILRRGYRYAQVNVLPPDPGPGNTVRRSYTVPNELLQAIKKYGRGRGYTVALRRIIVADMAGLLSNKD
jgi:hypothetical protein